MTLELAIRDAEKRKGEWLSEKEHGLNPAENSGSRYYVTHEHDIVDSYMKDRMPLRVAAYIREKVPNNGLRSPLELQRQLYETMISGHPGWQFAGAFMDKGSSLQLKNRPGLQALLASCGKGEIDVIICRNMSRLHESAGTVLEMVQHLADLETPVGVYFEAEETFSLRPENDATD